MSGRALDSRRTGRVRARRGRHRTRRRGVRLRRRHQLRAARTRFGRDDTSRRIRRRATRQRRHHRRRQASQDRTPGALTGVERATLHGPLFDRGLSSESANETTILFGSVADLRKHSRSSIGAGAFQVAPPSVGQAKPGPRHMQRVPAREMLLGWPRRVGPPTAVAVVIILGEQLITRTLEELRTPDERTQRFTPFGLGLTHELTPAAALAHQQAMLQGTDLVDAVADGTRLSFERLRTLYVYGVLQYEFFTIAEQLARLVVEQALRDRFLSYYQHRIVLVNPTSGEQRTEQVASFEQVHAAFKRRRSWKLKLTAPGESMAFDGMLACLWNWARREGLLPGQWARSIQRAQVALRNATAHPSGYHLGTPGDAALVIRDLAEIINCLWGTRTPGGRLHPAPVQRSVLLIAWDDTGRLEIGDIESVPSEHMAADAICILVRAVADNREDLIGFDDRFETTRYPVEFLWGPGIPDQARDWAAANRPDGDEVDHLDRHFAIRRYDAHLDAPRSVAVTAGLPPDRRRGTWFLVKGDDPLSAYNHIRNQSGEDGACARRGPCPNCPAHTIASGEWRAVLRRAEDVGIDTVARVPADVRVPSLVPQWRAFDGEPNIGSSCRDGGQQALSSGTVQA